jgi:hypothetical protein
VLASLVSWWDGGEGGGRGQVKLVVDPAAPSEADEPTAKRGGQREEHGAGGAH